MPSAPLPADLRATCSALCAAVESIEEGSAGVYARARDLRAALVERDEDGRTLADRLAEYPDGLRQIQRECELGSYLENVADDCEAAAAALLAASETILGVPVSLDPGMPPDEVRVAQVDGEGAVTVVARIVNLAAPERDEVRLVVREGEHFWVTRSEGEAKVTQAQERPTILALATPEREALARAMCLEAGDDWYAPDVTHGIRQAAWRERADRVLARLTADAKEAR